MPGSSSDEGSSHLKGEAQPQQPASASRRSALHAAVSVLLLPALPGAAGPLPAQAAETATAASSGESAPFGVPVDSLIKKFGKDLGIEKFMGNVTAARGDSDASVDTNTATALVGLGIIFFIVVPVLKFLLTGFATLFILRDADQRFSNASGQKPTKAFDRLMQGLSGGPPDALEQKRLRVWRLNDELSAMQIAIARQAQGTASGKLLREAARRERDLLAWQGFLDDLELTPKERKQVAAAVAKFTKKDSDRRDELVELQVGWIKRLVAGSFIPIWWERLRLGWESEKQIDLQAKLYADLADALPEEKVEKLLDHLAEAEDPLCVPSTGGRGNQVCVIAFDGDAGASRVQQLQMEVTAILLMDERPSEVIVLIRSPGGTVPGYGLAAAQLMRLRDHGLQVVACVDEVAASGGYLMACCAHKVICAPFAAIGSIGVISGVPNAADRLEREGIEVIETTAGKWKRTVTPFKTPSEEDLAKQKADIQVVYNQFASFVKERRPAVDLDVVATGEVWFGAAAMARGLVDEVSTSAEYLLQRTRTPGCEVLAMDYSSKPTGLPALFQASLQGVGAAGMSKLAETFATSFAQGLGVPVPGAGRGDISWPVGVTEPRFEGTDETGALY